MYALGGMRRLSRQAHAPHLGPYYADPICHDWGNRAGAYTQGAVGWSPAPQKHELTRTQHPAAHPKPSLRVASCRVENVLPLELMTAYPSVQNKDSASSLPGLFCALRHLVFHLKINTEKITFLFHRFLVQHESVI